MYYPKSQIKTNLYTSGKEYSLSTTKEEYIGYYYEISTGQQFTGKTPQDKPNILLQFSDSYPNPLIENQFTPPEEIVSLQSTDYVDPNPLSIRILPLYNLTFPTDQDKLNGQFNRYFCKKNNEIKYLEIDKDTYQKLQNKDPKIAWDLYTPVTILWVIQGNQTQVFNSNKATVQAIEQNARWYGFTQYFQNKFLKYYLSLDISNLYTSGGEFKTKNGREYIGFYHIHNGNIPMVGKTHIKEFHETLIPISQSLSPTPINQTSSMSPTTISPTLSSGGSSGGGGGY
jgi:hypothetical protein